MLKKGLLLTVLLCSVQCDTLPFYGARREYRSINTSHYEISVSKAGTFSAALPNGFPILSQAYPFIEMDTDKQPRPLKTYAQYSTRTMIRSPLGEGHGFLFQKGNCAWAVNAYTTEPFFTVQVVFVNTSRETVKVSRLGPLSALVPLDLNRDSNVVQTSASDAFPEEQTQTKDVFWTTLPKSGSNLFVTFLTRTSSEVRIQLERDTTRMPRPAVLRAECIYEPPVAVPPGGTLTSDVLYVYLGEEPYEKIVETAQKRAAKFPSRS